MADVFMLLSHSSSELCDLYEKKEQALMEKFSEVNDPQKVYEIIITLGKSLPIPASSIQTEANLVEGCQSTAYIASELNSESLMLYQIQSEALISAGLAALLFAIYNKEPAALILMCPPSFIQKLGLHSSLSPGRSNGLASLYARMKQDALHLFLNSIKK